MKNYNLLLQYPRQLPEVGWAEARSPTMSGVNMLICWASFVSPTYEDDVFLMKRPFGEGIGC